MKIPEKFQFRHTSNKGFTHCAKVVDDEVQIKWARGWHEYVQSAGDDDGPLWSIASIYEVSAWIAEGGWILVDENKKAEEKPLPDEFEFEYIFSDGTKAGIIYTAQKDGGDYRVTWKGDEVGIRESIARAVAQTANGSWKILEKKTASKYPDVFHFISFGDRYTLHKIGAEWACTYYGLSLDEQKKKNGDGLAMYSEKTLTLLFESGHYQLWEPKKLTPEQLARNKEIQEQIEQLNKSIDECDNFKENLWVQTQHYNTLIKSYEDRIEVLKKGLVEE